MANKDIKAEPVRIAVRKNELQEIYKQVLEIRDVQVEYNPDQLVMAQEAIRKMKKNAENIATYLYITGVTR